MGYSGRVDHILVVGAARVIVKAEEQIHACDKDQDHTLTEVHGGIRQEVDPDSDSVHHPLHWVKNDHHDQTDH